MKRHSQRGVALVITLIMLAVITFMAITFLVLSRREKGSVTTQTDEIVAKDAADSALNRSLVEEIGRILAATNDQAYGFMVSTNYINWGGFISSGFPLHNPTNVNFSYLSGGGPLSLAQQADNVANLLYDPRVPVYVPVSNNTAQPDFRYYIDLNRNGRYDTNGFWPVQGPNLGIYIDTNGNQTPLLANAAYSSFVGDPEWIGQLERPDLPHSSSNRFVSRYAYMVLPAGKTLDINAIYNQALLAAAVPAGTGSLPLLGTAGQQNNIDGYLRNQGVGTWEVNLAAFLADLNTNVIGGWPQYGYNRWQGGAGQNIGIPFNDAFALLNYRYGGNYGSLQPARSVFPNAGLLATNVIDYYSDGSLMFGSSPKNTGIFPDPTGKPWLGSDNTNHFFGLQDFFDPTKIREPLPNPNNFIGRMIALGRANDSYSRYTFPRMLSQLSTDGATDSDKINVNYINTLVGVTNNRVSGTFVPGAEENLLSWTPTNFFLAAAERMFETAGFPPNVNSPGRHLSPTWIPIWPTNYYTPAVHHILQLAANIYDATGNTNHPAPLNAQYPQYPTVFRPIFRFDPASGQVVISDYREVVDNTIDGWGINSTMVDPRIPSDRSRLLRLGAPEQRNGDQNEQMVYGIPLIIGAKKGYPNFNEMSAVTFISAERMMQFLCPNAISDPPNATVTATNPMYMIGISNILSVEAWNSYSNSYPRNLQVRMAADVTGVLTNSFNSILLSNQIWLTTISNIPANRWTGYENRVPLPQSSLSFVVPMASNYISLLTSSYYFNPEHLVTPWTTNFQSLAPNTPGGKFPVPRWWLNLDVRLRFILEDTAVNPPRIVDYVNIDSGGKLLDLTAALAAAAEATQGQSSGGGVASAPVPVYMWDTNRVNNADLNSITVGMNNQIQASLGLLTVAWNPYNRDPNVGQDVVKAEQGFYYNIFGRNGPGDGSVHVRQPIFYAPYVPYDSVQMQTDWQVNDPLVHYTVADLTDLFKTNTYTLASGPGQQTNSNIGQLNDRFEPWGGNPYANSSSSTKWDLSVKDPLVRRSDDWDFPTNKLPNIGWLGRVHRGTPWQTVFLKATNIVAFGSNTVPPIPRLATWQQWSGDGNSLPGNGYLPAGGANGIDALLSAPVNDQKLFDIFTAVPNENASRGRMSINQDGLAGWSAILSGVLLLTNYTTDSVLQSLVLGSTGSPPIPTGTNIILPAAIYSSLNPPALVQILNGINRTRTNLYAGTFNSLGNLLSTPELTERSPYLNWNSPVQFKYGINDEMYERIPQQIMGLVGLSHVPRMVIYSWGQTLRPADNSVLTSGPHQGMVTNYQVTAEVATRAVVRVEGLNTTPPNPHVIIENFNVLPPDQ